VNVGRDVSIQYSVAHQAPVRPTAAGTLPRDIGALVGRGPELEHIVSSSSPGRVVTIHTIDGMPGIGKTTLAVRAAHRLAPEFPDGQYFVELHGHTPGHTPAEPVEVLARLLTAVGVDSQFLPATLEARRDLWRDRTTGKRMLLVLDDARDHAHVEALLPGTGGCLTLITSRRHLTALDGAVDLPLDVLEPDAAAQLFTTVSRRTPTTDTELRAVEQIVRLCGYLPLAIVLLAGRLAHHRSWSIRDLADDFATAQDRLDELEAGPRSVQVAFSMSYQGLPPEQQHLFCCLGLHPGSEIDAPAAAALTGVSTISARRLLEGLYTDHFIEETHPGRYRLHDLLRAYARDRGDIELVESRGEAIDRLLDYYRNSADSANRYVARHAQPAAHPREQTGNSVDFDGKQALAWLRIERSNLFACLDYAAARDPQRFIALTEAIAGLMERDGPWNEGTALYQRASEAARHLDDPIGEANALTNLGSMRQEAADHDEAAELFQQALTIYRELGDSLGEANCLSNLGNLHRMVGEHAASVELHQKAVVLHRQLGNQLGEARTLMTFGLARIATGDYGEARDHLQEALRLYRDLGNQLGEAFTSTNLGEVFRYTGDYVRAAQLQEQALVLFREIHKPLGEADALTALGDTRVATGNHDEAAELYQDALSLQRQVGSRSNEAFTLGRLGEVKRITGDYAEASRLQQRALSLAREVGFKRVEAEILNRIGTLLHETDQVRDALSAFIEAHELARSILSQLEEARALEGSSQCRIYFGERSAAIAELQEAVTIYRRLAAPDAEPASRRLAALESMSPPR
jgi:tetratricopeptide (TPR) repeat protein